MSAASRSLDGREQVTEVESQAAFRTLEDVDITVSLQLRHRLTIPHRVPHNTESVGKRQLKTLPCFTCVVHVPAPWMPHDLLLAGQQSGTIIQWKIPHGSSGAGSAPGAPASAAKSGPTTINQHIVFGTHKGNVTCMCYDDGSKLLLTGSSDTNIKLWDVTASDSSSARCVQTLNAHDATVTAIAVHCNLILSGSIDKTMKVWKFEEGREGLRFPWAVARQVFVFDSWVTSLWASPRKIAETSQGEVFVGDSNGGLTVLRSAVVHTDEGDSVTATHVELLRRTPAPNPDKRQAITKLFPIPNLNLIISLSFDSCAVVSDLVGFHPLVSIPHPLDHRFVDCCWDPATEEVTLLDGNGYIYIWDTRSNRMRCQQFVGHSTTALVTVLGQMKNVSWVAERDAVLSFTVERTSSIVEHQGHTDRIITVCIANNNARFGGGGSSELSTPTNPQIGSSTSPSSKHSPPSSSRGATSAAGGELADDLIEFFLATASVDNTICLWTQNMTLLKQYKEKYSEISSFLALPSLGWLVSGHDNGSVKFWSLSKDKTFRFTGHENTVSGVYEGFHRYGRGTFEPWHHFFTISYDGCLAVWEQPMEGAKAKCEGRIRVSSSELICAVYDSIKHCYIVGGNIGDISMWSVDELKPIRTLCHPAIPPARKPRPAHQEAVTSLALDGNYVFSGGEDERIYFWNTVSGELMKPIVHSGNENIGEIQNFVVLPETGDLLACTRAGYIFLFSQERGVATHFYELSKEVTSLAYNRPTGEIIAGLDEGVILRIHLTMLQPVPEEEEEGTFGEEATNTSSADVPPTVADTADVVDVVSPIDARGHGVLGPDFGSDEIPEEIEVSS